VKYLTLAMPPAKPFTSWNGASHPWKPVAKREHSNGNGSLMRILPVVFYHKTLELSNLIQRTHQVSRITHAHPRSQMACGIYISIAACLLEGLAPKQAYLEGGQNVREIYSQPPYASEMANFKRIFSDKLDELPEKEIQSDGYVISTL